MLGLEVRGGVIELPESSRTSVDVSIYFQVGVMH